MCRISCIYVRYVEMEGALFSPAIFSCTTFATFFAPSFPEKKENKGTYVVSREGLGYVLKLRTLLREMQSFPNDPLSSLLNHSLS